MNPLNNCNITHASIHIDPSTFLNTGLPLSVQLASTYVDSSKLSNARQSFVRLHLYYIGLRRQLPLGIQLASTYVDPSKLSNTRQPSDCLHPYFLWIHVNT